MEHDICIAEEEIDGQKRRCPHFVVARGYCQTHYKRWKRYGDPNFRKRIQAYTGQLCCHPDNCPRVARKDGWCKMHYDRIQVHGEPGPVQEQRSRNKAVGRVRSSGGYIQIYDIVRKRYVMEHRLVMEREKRRELYPFENVHHKNGDKQDNRPENLEIWMAHQPSGQRPEDIVAWAVEYYPELVRAEQKARRQDKKSGQLRLVN